MEPITPSADMLAWVANDPEQAKRVALRDMQRLTTHARRTAEVARALAQQTGQPDDLERVRAIDRQIGQLDQALAEMLEAT